MQFRSLTHLTNAFSEKWENLRAAHCHASYDNFCRIQHTTRVTPVMEAGITDQVRNLAGLLA